MFSVLRCLNSRKAQTVNVNSACDWLASCEVTCLSLERGPRSLTFVSGNIYGANNCGLFIPPAWDCSWICFMDPPPPHPYALHEDLCLFGLKVFVMTDLCLSISDLVVPVSVLRQSSCRYRPVRSVTWRATVPTGIQAFHWRPAYFEQLT